MTQKQSGRGTATVVKIDSGFKMTLRKPLKNSIKRLLAFSNESDNDSIVDES